MRLAILSDIHGNYDALVAVLADIKNCQCDAIISLGDNIGYGPDSPEVIDALQKAEVISVQGNHERAMFDDHVYEGLNFQAQENNDAIKASLSPEYIEYCGQLPLSLHREGALFVHGFPPACTETYLSAISDEEVVAFWNKNPEQIVFVGHTHRLQSLRLHKEQVEKFTLVEGVTSLCAEDKYILNAGSVGQPRTKDKRAQYLLWDVSRQSIETRFVSYDPLPCATRIRERGWPEIYALRLLPPV